MAIFDLFSKRQKRLRGEVPDIYSYDNLPDKLRVQIVHIINDAFGEGDYHGRDKKAYHFIRETLCREYGLFFLGKIYKQSDKEQVINFILKTNSTEELIDAIELSFKIIGNDISGDSNSHHFSQNSRITSEDAISELNDRFKENGIGYSFEGGQIVKIDSTYVHNGITKPTISLLSNKKFKGANDEYLKAHEHYRQGRNKECLAESLKAFESTMKIICSEKGWTFNPTDTANKLIQNCFQNGLVPAYAQAHFTSLKSLLESGIPTVRNKLGGHGQGQSLVKVEDEIARYGLNLAGTNIILLIELSGIK